MLNIIIYVHIKINYKIIFFFLEESFYKYSLAYMISAIKYNLRSYLTVLLV